MKVNGFGSAFDEDKFRTAIRNTMLMGMPQTVSERVVFRWTDNNTYDHTDAEGRPLNWYSSPVSTSSHPDVEIPVALDFAPNRSQAGSTVVGSFDNPKAVLTVLDVDYDLVKGADKVIIDDSTYDVEYVGPPEGLFGVTVYSVYIRANDEH